MLAPASTYPIFIVVSQIIHLYPRAYTGAKISYYKIVTDLTYNDNTESEIPPENQAIIIERVVMQIKSADGKEDIKQIKKAEVDKDIIDKYKLDALTDKDDKGNTQ